MKTNVLKLIQKRETIVKKQLEIVEISSIIAKQYKADRDLAEYADWQTYREEIYDELALLKPREDFPSRFKAHIIKIDGTSEKMECYPELGMASISRGHAIRRLMCSGELLKNTGQTTAVVTQLMDTTSKKPLTKSRSTKHDERRNKNKSTNKTDPII